jgi:hypothetical protein
LHQAARRAVFGSFVADPTARKEAPVSNQDLVSRLLEIAHDEVGTTEYPAGSNRNPYGKYFDLDGVPWCALFVSWCFAKAGAPLPDIGQLGAEGGFASCQAAVQYANSRGEITDAPEPGDIVLFDWEQDGHSDHTGLVVDVLDAKRFRTVEGNTAVGDDSNGGAVMRRERNVRTVSCFWHPPVLDAGSSSDEVDDAPGACEPATVPGPELIDGDRSGIEALQRYLGELAQLFGDGSLDPGPPDGLDGSRTLAALRAWQTRVGTTPDGVWGAGTHDASCTYTDWLVTELCRLHALSR